MTADLAWVADQFLTTVEVAGLFSGAIPLDVRQWCQLGLVRYVKDLPSRKYLLYEADVWALGERTGWKAPTQEELRRLVAQRQLRGAGLTVR